MASVGDAELLVFELHRRSLTMTSGKVGRHLQGLRQGASSLRGQLSNRAHRRLSMIDLAYTLLRHITSASVEEFLGEESPVPLPEVKGNFSVQQKPTCSHVAAQGVFPFRAETVQQPRPMSSQEAVEGYVCQSCSSAGDFSDSD